MVASRLNKPFLLYRGSTPLPSAMKKINPEAQDFINMVMKDLDDPVFYDQLINNFMEEANHFFMNKPLVKQMILKKLIKASYEYGSPRYKNGQSPVTDAKEIQEELIDGAIGWPMRKIWNEKQK